MAIIIMVTIAMAIITVIILIRDVIKRTGLSYNNMGGLSLCYRELKKHLQY